MSQPAPASPPAPPQPAAPWPPPQPGFAPWSPPQGVPSYGEDEIPCDGFSAAPPGYHVETRRNTGLVIGGAVTLGAPYFLSAVVASSASRTAEHNWLFVPVIGPWVSLGMHDTCPHSPGEEAGVCIDLAPAAYVVDGIGQVAGALMLVAGLVDTYPVFVRNGIARSAAPSRPMLSIAPAWFGRGTAGINLSLALDGAPPPL
jgi:hypothetical protein